MVGRLKHFQSSNYSECSRKSWNTNIATNSDIDNTNLKAQIMPQENLEIKNPEFVIEGVSLNHTDKDTNSLSLNIQINEVFGNFKINNEYHVEHKFLD